jgi:hypothetical protein
MPTGRAHSTDIDIRKALLTKKLSRLRSEGVLVIDELGLAHAKSRVDVAVINGSLHGYEIKSAQDSLTRLPAQIATYRDTLERLRVAIAAYCARTLCRPALTTTPFSSSSTRSTRTGRRPV